MYITKKDTKAFQKGARRDYVPSPILFMFVTPKKINNEKQCHPSSIEGIVWSSKKCRHRHRSLIGKDAVVSYNTIYSDRKQLNITDLWAVHRAPAANLTVSSSAHGDPSRS